MFEQAVSGWHKVSLTDLAAYINGYAFKPEDWSEHGLPIVRIAQITGSSAECDYFRGSLGDDYKVDNGDVIFSWSGTLCVVRWSGGPAWLNQHLFKVKPVDGVNERLLYHLLSHAVEEMNKSAHGSTMKHIKRGELKRYQLLFPLREDEQAKLADILDTLDTQIQKTEALIAKLEKVKEGLLHDLLTRGIDENGQLRPSPELAPELYRDSPLGLIPEPWDTVQLSELILQHNSGLYTPKSSYGQGTPMLGVSSLYSMNVLKDQELRRAPIPDYLKEKYLLTEGDIVYGESSLVLSGIAKTVVVGQLGEGKGFEWHTRRLRVNQDIAHPSFISAQLSHFQPVRKKIMSVATQTALTGMTTQDFFSVSVVLPKLSEQKAVFEKLSQLEERVQKENVRLIKMESLKKGLMNDLLTGRVRVTPLLEKAQQATSA